VPAEEVAAAQSDQTGAKAVAAARCEYGRRAATATGARRGGSHVVCRGAAPARPKGVGWARGVECQAADGLRLPAARSPAQHATLPIPSTQDGASREQVRRAYRARLLQLHPDKAGADRAAAPGSTAAAFHRLQAAHRALTAPPPEQRFDALVATGAAFGRGALDEALRQGLGPADVAAMWVGLLGWLVGWLVVCVSGGCCFAGGHCSSDAFNAPSLPCSKQHNYRTHPPPHSTHPRNYTRQSGDGGGF